MMMMMMIKNVITIYPISTTPEGSPNLPPIPGEFKTHTTLECSTDLAIMKPFRQLLSCVHLSATCEYVGINMLAQGLVWMGFQGGQVTYFVPSRHQW